LSPGNIVIVPERVGDSDTSGGLLIDWDLCKVTEASANPVSTCRYSWTVSSTFDVQYLPSPDTFLQGDMAIYGSGAQ